MTPSVADIWDALARWAPLDLAESWDNVGLQIGDPHASVNRLLVALDATGEVLTTAISRKAQMVITHHPLLFRPIKSLDTSQHVPRLAAGFLRADIALAAGHTNIDSVPGGVNDVLANALDLKDCRPLVPSAERKPPAGLGRIGAMRTPSTLEALARRVAGLLGNHALLVVGRPECPVQRVAVCGGSGSDLWPAAVAAGADCFISAEIKHHIAREAEELERAIIDAGHFFTEWPIVPVLTQYLRGVADRNGWQLEVSFLEEEASPFGVLVSSAVKADRITPGRRPGKMI